MTTVELLKAERINVRFGGVRALTDVDLTVPAASIVGIVGPNGAGKSTLFGVLSGLVRPTSGLVLFRGKDISGVPASVRARAGLARTFQHPELFAGLTVRQHLQLSYRMRYQRRRMWLDLLRLPGRIPTDVDERSRCDQLLRILGLEAYEERSVLGLPLGIARLVEVGRALASAPALVLLDEPLAGLDRAESARLIRVLVEVVQTEGLAILLVDHDFETVASVADTIVVLDFGVAIANGPPSVIRDLPEVRLAYLGASPVGASDADI